ncbi:hypothetical protein EVAR_13154_1 [Eumeta japonica]|uniref:Uncharacterized protein n=1 Tax=Eumeta variegata TaxID=151549 RepID=A0A4C1U9L9_EUMVA|nr:hypothetical protein EVAR_13154_1 [Eumeta japonica]
MNARAVGRRSRSRRRRGRAGAVARRGGRRRMHATGHTDRSGGGGGGSWRLPPDETLQVADPKSAKEEVRNERIIITFLSHDHSAFSENRRLFIRKLPTTNIYCTRSRHLIIKHTYQCSRTHDKRNNAHSSSSLSSDTQCGDDTLASH